MTVILGLLYISLFLLALGAVGSLSRNLQRHYTVALESMKNLQGLLIESQNTLLKSGIAHLQTQQDYGKALGQIDEMRSGRQFDQKLLTDTLARAERYRRVLEAVLRSQGCTDERIAYVLQRADQDLDVEI